MIEFGLLPADQTALARFITMLDRSEARLVLETQAEIEVLAQAVAAAMSRQFQTGTDKQGRSHNKTGETLKTLHVSIRGTTAVISMGRGAVFVQYGSKPHVIEARPGGTLRWQEDGRTFYARRVNHPGYKGDDFVGRALEEVMGANALAQILDRFGITMFGTGARGQFGATSLR